MRRTPCARCCASRSSWSHTRSCATVARSEGRSRTLIQPRSCLPFSPCLTGKVTARSVRGTRSDPGERALHVPLHDDARARRDPDRGVVSGCGSRARDRRSSRSAGATATTRLPALHAWSRTAAPGSRSPGSGRSPCSSRVTTLMRLLPAVSPADDIHASADYRRQLVRVLTGRAIASARERAGAAG